MDIKEMLQDLLEKIKSALEYIIDKFKAVFSPETLDKVKSALGVIKTHLSKLASYSKQKASTLYTKLSHSMEKYYSVHGSGKGSHESIVSDFADELNNDREKEDTPLKLIDNHKYTTHDSGWITYLDAHERK